MRDLTALNAYRQREQERAWTGGIEGDGGNGMFVIASPLDNEPLRIIAATGGGWEHVSVSRKDRCPTWEEMDFIARTFFQAHEWAMQLHVPRSDHINAHPNCLHLWRPTGKPIPRPPSIFVG